METKSETGGNKQVQASVRKCIPHAYVPSKNQTPRLNSSPSPFLQEHKTFCLILAGCNLYAWFPFSSDPILFQRFHQGQNCFFCLLHLKKRFTDMQIRIGSHSDLVLQLVTRIENYRNFVVCLYAGATKGT